MYRRDSGENNGFLEIKSLLFFLNPELDPRVTT